MSSRAHKLDQGLQYTYPQQQPPLSRSDTIDVYGVCHFRVMPRNQTYWTDLPEEVVKDWIKEGKFTYIPLTDGHIALSEYPIGTDFPARLGYVTDVHIDPEHNDVVFSGKLFKDRVSHLNLTKGNGMDLVSLTHTVHDGECIAPLEIAILRLDRESPRRGGCFVIRSDTSFDIARKRIKLLTRMRSAILS